MKNLKIILFSVVFICNSKAWSAIYSNANGNWNSSSTWLKNGGASLPACGDTIYIEANNTVTITSQESYTGCSSPLYIYVKGILQFTNGNKLDLPCGSLVNILNGGVVKKATAGGGNSTLISICGATLWNAGMGALTGPVYLPVSLLNFEVNQEDEHILIKWATASETNNDYFIVQRSLASSEFSDISIVKGQGNSNFIQNYSSVDTNPPSGVLYYRLCQVDFNGERHYYPPSALSVKTKSVLIVFPNPASKEYVSILFNTEADNIYSLELRDMNGKLIIKKENRTAHSGYNALVLNNYYRFSRGTYFITFFINNRVYQEKIIIS